jgi:hypothetical protein
MSPASSPPESRALAFLTALFILSFSIFFSYSGLFSYFTFDDGTTVISCLRPFETPFWRDLLHVLTVFTTAFRPLTTMFWRPLYALFGFNPLPYRIAVHLLLTVNIGLAYLLARRLEMTREAAALTALIFCYNASTNALYYDTCLVGDILCFLFYALTILLYIGGRLAGQPIGLRRTVAVAATYFLALDSKELAVTLPGVLLIYELLYRRPDLREKQKALRVGGWLAVMFVLGAIYLKVKVADMSQNPAYTPHVSVIFLLKNLGFYLHELLYLPESWATPVTACLVTGGLIAAGALLRSRPVVFGVLYFVTALIPVAAIESRTGYAAYVPYFGLALTVGAIVSGARSHLIRLTRRKDLEMATAVILFVGFAMLLGWAHMVRRMPGNRYFEWDKPRVMALMDDFRRTIPEFPPHARVLLTDDVDAWGPDWGPMFLLRLLYHDNTVWVDRPKNMERPADLALYDLVASYQAPDIDLSPVRFHKHPMKWEIRGQAVMGTGQFEVSSPNAHGAASHVDFAPQAVRGNQSTTVTIPGLSNIAVNVLYRVESGTKSTRHLVENWCTLDARGTCTIPAPRAGAPGRVMIDWIQPANQRWIFTSGFLSIVE